MNISGCCSVFIANTRDRDGFAVGFHRQIEADSGQFQELGSEQRWMLFVPESGLWMLCGIREVKPHLPAVSSPKTDLSKTLAPDHFLLWSTFFPETTGDWEAISCFLLKMENYCKLTYVILMHTHTCMSYMFVPIHIQWRTHVLFVTKHQCEFRFAAKSLQVFDSTLRSAL